MAEIKRPEAVYNIPDDVREKLMTAVNESVAIGSGRGSSQSLTQTLLSRHDRFRNSAVQTNADNVGLTFITRPRLNLSTRSIRQDPILSMMDTLDPLSWMFSLRCNLDTEFARSPLASSLAKSCPWYNDESPFNVPLGNMLLSMSGWPDFSLQYETTESGYYSQDMTMARGSDWGRRTYELSCTFRDIQGGYIMAYFYYWLIAMTLQMDGNIVAYPDDRDANRLNYTCSIYRFVMDPSMTTITKWAKATGCYPVNVPLGDVFNFGQDDSFVHTSQQFTIPFVANHVRYMDPRQLWQFNTLVSRYCKDITSKDRVKTKVIPEHNFTGVPWIDTRTGNNNLMYLARKEELVDPTESTLAEIRASIKDGVSKLTAKA
jgi:hypothetical protein